MSRVAQDFADWYRRIRVDPLVFASEAMMSIDPDDRGSNNPRLTQQQIALLTAVQKETQLPLEERLKRIAVKSGQGTGKTTCEVILALWRAFQDVDTLVVVTAPTQNQIKDVWFAEARRLLLRSHPYLRRMCETTAMQIRIGGRKDWRIMGKAASKPENFQGFHQRQLTFIVDEASGVDREILRTIKGTVTNSDSLLVCAGNPNTRECAFFDMFHKPSERMMWHRFTFNAEDSPITDKENIRRIAHEFGRNSDVYRVRVLGEFPIADPNCVMSSEDLWACAGVSMAQAARMRTDCEFDKAIAIDFARFGSDESVIYRRSGMAIVEQKVFARTEPMTVVDHAIRMQARACWPDRDCIYIVDAGGMGQGVVANLHRYRKRVHEFQTQHRSSAPDYANKMTEAYFRLRKLSQERRMHIPDDEHLVLQLSSRLYKTDNKSKIVLEKKDDYMKRMEGQSPDRADALAMAFYDATLARGRVR